MVLPTNLLKSVPDVILGPVGRCQPAGQMSLVASVLLDEPVIVPAVAAAKLYQAPAVELHCIAAVVRPLVSELLADVDNSAVGVDQVLDTLELALVSDLLDTLEP